MSAAHFLLLLFYICGVCGFTHRLRFDDSNDIGISDSTLRGYPEKVNWKQGGVRSDGGHALFGDGSRIRLGRSDSWQLGREFSIMFWVLPGSTQRQAVLSVGNKHSTARCKSWSPASSGHIANTAMLLKTSASDLSTCRSLCSSQATCLVVTFSASTSDCILFSKQLSYIHISANAYTQDTVYSECSPQLPSSQTGIYSGIDSSAFTIYVDAGQNEVGLVWNEVCIIIEVIYCLLTSHCYYC